MSRIGFALVAVLVAGSSVSANILVNGDFENMPNWNNGIGGDGSYTLLVGAAIPGWTIEADHGATIHSNPGIYPTISGAYSLNTDGEGLNGHNVNMFQDFASTSGVQYEFAFDWENWFGSETPLLNVTIEDVVSRAVLVNASYGLAAGLHHEVFSFTGSGNALRLRIQHSPESGFNDNTFIVDNFDVTEVPGPGAAALLGLGAVSTFRRRRR